MVLDQECLPKRDEKFYQEEGQKKETLSLPKHE